MCSDVIDLTLDTKGTRQRTAREREYSEPTLTVAAAVENGAAAAEKPGWDLKSGRGGPLLQVRSRGPAH
jgi:hypothetical protein